MAARLLARMLFWAAMPVGAGLASAEPLTDLLANACSSVPEIPTTSARAVCSRTPQGVVVRLTASRIARSKPLAPIALPDGRSLSLYHALVYNGSLTPEVWVLKPGDTLEVALRNRLPPQRGKGLVHLTNLHAHGLIVRPDLIFAGDAADPLRVTRAGDNVFACTAFSGRGRDCAHMAHMRDRVRRHAGRRLRVSLPYPRARRRRYDGARARAAMNGRASPVTRCR